MLTGTGYLISREVLWMMYKSLQGWISGTLLNPWILKLFSWRTISDPGQALMQNSEALHDLIFLFDTPTPMFEAYQSLAPLYRAESGCSDAASLALLIQSRKVYSFGSAYPALRRSVLYYF